MMFANYKFFIGAFCIAMSFLIIKKAREIKGLFFYIVSALSLICSLYVFKSSLVHVFAFFGVSFFALKMHRMGIFKKYLSVILTLLPLLGVKTGAYSLFQIVGLSFITFRALDVLIYEDNKSQINWLAYVTYLFFPLVIIAGPMYRWNSFKDDMLEGYERISSKNFIVGFEYLLIGISQKFLFAYLIDISLLSNPKTFSFYGVIFNAITYSTYLYFDFAGYSNMAMGIGKMFGLSIPINFNNPWLARNPNDFWKRWHISLSEWLRDVVFTPLYMTLSRLRFFQHHKLVAQNIGVFTTLTIMGIWNGLSLHYILSGLMFATYSVIFNSLISYRKSSRFLIFCFESPLICFVGRLVTILLLVLALYVFSGRSFT